jgi:hypothetical protein
MFKNYFDVDKLRQRVLLLYPDHSGNSEACVGAREVGHEGMGPAFFVERARLADTEAEALRLAKQDLMERHCDHQETIKNLQKENAVIIDLLRQIDQGAQA